MALSFKVTLIGDTYVGKSSLITRLCTNKLFTNMESTIGSSFNAYKYKIDDKTINLHIWDTAGQERFRSIVPLYIRDAVAVIFVYDMSNRDSINSLLQYWISYVNNHANPNYVPFILGTKKDKSILTKHELDQLNDKFKQKLQLDTEMFLTSAVNGDGIRESFETIGRILLDKPIIKQKNDSLLEWGGSNKNDDTSKMNERKTSQGCCNIL